MHDVRRVLERRPPQTTRVRRRPEPQLVHYRGPIRPVDDVLVPPEPGVAAAIPKQRREALVLVVLVKKAQLPKLFYGAWESRHEQSKRRHRATDIARASAQEN